MTTTFEEWCKAIKEAKNCPSCPLHKTDDISCYDIVDGCGFFVTACAVLTMYEQLKDHFGSLQEARDE